MKIISFWEFHPEDLDTLVEKFRKLREDREKDPEKHAKYLFPHHYMGIDEDGVCKGFVIVDANQEQLETASVLAFPEMRSTNLPIMDFSKWLEQYMKSNQ